MEVYDQIKLVLFGNRHADARNALHAWHNVVKNSTWTTPHDIKARFNGADFLSGNRVIFNIKGNHYRLVAQIDYGRASVAIEWVGTHAEYDKQSFR